MVETFDGSENHREEFVLMTWFVEGLLGMISVGTH